MSNNTINSNRIFWKITLYKISRISASVTRYRGKVDMYLIKRRVHVSHGGNCHQRAARFASVRGLTTHRVVFWSTLRPAALVHESFRVVCGRRERETSFDASVTCSSGMWKIGLNFTPGKGLGLGVWRGCYWIGAILVG